MILHGFLTITKAGTVKFTKSKPSVGIREVAIETTIKIPDGYFTRPSPVVSIELPEPGLIDVGVAVSLTAQTIAESFNVKVEGIRDGLYDLVANAMEEQSGQ